MERNKNWGRLILAGLLAVTLISGAFVGTTSVTVFAEGGGNGPMPTDSTVSSSGIIDDPDPGTEEWSTWDSIALLAQSIL